MGLGMLFIMGIFIAGLRRTSWRVPTVLCAISVVLNAIALAVTDAPPAYTQGVPGQVARSLLLVWMIWGAGRGVARALHGRLATSNTPPS